MGLDMYLDAELYVGGWRHSEPKEKNVFKAIEEATGLSPCSDSPSFHVKATVAYWRKANAVHKWFVDNVQGGEDDCRQAYVSRDQLRELVGKCKELLKTVETVDGKVHTGTTLSPDETVEHYKDGKVVAQQDLAGSMLPTQGGFFFGSTDYDEYYLEDIRDTVKQLEAVLSSDAYRRCEFYYHSSW